MTEQQLHELAIAYAQVKLQNNQVFRKSQPGYNPFALTNFEQEFDSLD